MDLDPEEATAIQMALDEIIEESGDYDVVDVSEVIPSRVGGPPLLACEPWSCSSGGCRGRRRGMFRCGGGHPGEHPTSRGGAGREATEER